MEHTLATFDVPLELRVLDGPQRGARTAVKAGVPCVIATDPDGFADGADIVLREANVAPVQVRLIPGFESASIGVAEGEVRLGDKPLKAGTEALWTMCAPLVIGGAIVAFGPAGEENWLARDPDAQTEADQYPAVSIGKPPQRRLRPEPVLAVVGGIAAVVCAALLWLDQSAPQAARVVPADPATQLTEALARSEFAALDVRQDPMGRIALIGRLGSLADRSRLDGWLAENHFNPKVSVVVDESLAHQVTEVFRINHVTVQAKVAGPGHIDAEAAETDAARLARAEEAARRDVVGLVSLAVQNRATPVTPASPPMPDDPNKRIASVVAGTPAYVVTADGACYFEGALLPSGHRITAIAAQRVTVERDGQPTTLNF